MPMEKIPYITELIGQGPITQYDHEVEFRPWFRYLKRRGVTLVETYPGCILECDCCGFRWSPNIRPGPGRAFYRGYSKCAYECN